MNGPDRRVRWGMALAMTAALGCGPTSLTGDANKHPDAAALATDATRAPLAGGACTTDGGAPPGWTTISGKVGGPDLTGTLSSGAELDDTPQGLMLHLSTGVIVQPFSGAAPGAAVVTNFAGWTSVPSLTPGTYTSADTCGSFLLDVALPPPDLVCAPDDAGVCPPGCDAILLSDPAPCNPTRPQVAFAAQAASDCHQATSPVGVWSLTLTSVGQCPDNGPLIVHGTLDVDLKEQGDAGSTAVTTSFAF